MFAMLAAAGIGLTGTSASAGDPNYKHCPYGTTAGGTAGTYPWYATCAYPGSPRGYTNADTPAFKAFQQGFCRSYTGKHVFCPGR